MRSFFAGFMVALAALAFLGAEMDVTSRAAAAETIVVAQNDRQPSLFRFLFGPRRNAQPQRQEPQTRQRAPQRSTPRRSTRRSTPRAPVEPQVDIVEKAEDAKRVLVVGDFFARSIAKGLDEAFAENPKVMIIQAANGSSGLVRDDFYDWPARLPELIAEHKPDAVVVMLGGNDRQEIGKLAVRGDEWNEAYGDRVAKLANVIAESGEPGIWVGLVPVASSVMSRDYSAFNSIYRETLEDSPVKFVDVWNGFADDEGKYVASGPDMNGQNRQLRVGDGLNFTRAGQRKLAFFIERDLQEILKTGSPFLASLEEGEAAAEKEARPAISAMIPIDKLILGNAGGLSTYTPRIRAEQPTGAGKEGSDEDAPAAEDETAAVPRSSPAEAAPQKVEEEDVEPEAEALLAKMIAGTPPPAGRIDDYRWPPERRTPPVKAADKAAETSSEKPAESDESASAATSPEAEADNPEPDPAERAASAAPAE
ncbi:SGNH/GDSL hydrolase family protein [Afifella aestuarii]|uniref:SGNH/GDSL hydrolase family protein n=1 Tax=Afifella aestuarii TaxID=1909496 RepID=UPI000FE43551|nr:SGNH family hydrolase [Afifella aestuarii]